MATNIKKWFIKETEEDVVKQQESQTPVSTVSIVKDIPVSTINVAAVKSEYTNEIKMRIINSNQPGPDILEVKQRAKPLLQFIPDITQAYTAAITQIKAECSDFCKDACTRALVVYKKVVEDWKNEKIAEINSTRQERVAQKQSIIDQNSKNIEEIDKWIAEKQKDKERYYQLNLQLQAQIAEASNDLDKKESEVVAAAAEMSASLDKDRDIISTINF